MLEGRPVCVVGSELLGTLLEGRELGDELLGLLDQVAGLLPGKEAKTETQDRGTGQKDEE